MMWKKTFLFLGYIVYFSSVIVIISCDTDHIYIGMYKIYGDLKYGSEKDYIELKENGKGVWKLRDDEFLFTWNIKYNKLYIHTKNGVLIAEISKNKILKLMLPGKRVILFKKI